MNPRTFGLRVALTAACSDSGTPPATEGSQATDAGTRQGPDGLVYVLTDGEDAKLLRLAPAGA